MVKVVGCRPSQVVESERRRLTELPRRMVLPTGRTTLRTVVLPSSFITEPRGTYRHGGGTIPVH